MHLQYHVSMGLGYSNRLMKLTSNIHTWCFTGLTCITKCQINQLSIYINADHLQMSYVATPSLDMQTGHTEQKHVAIAHVYTSIYTSNVDHWSSIKPITSEVASTSKDLLLHTYYQLVRSLMVKDPIKFHLTLQTKWSFALTNFIKCHDMSKVWSTYWLTQGYEWHDGITYTQHTSTGTVILLCVM